MSKFKEKELEDWMCENIQSSMEWTSKFLPKPYRYRVIGRQVPCKGGILDLLVEVTAPGDDLSPIHLIVLELKAKPGKRQDIEQVDRYVREVKSTLDLMCFEESIKDELRHFSELTIWRALHEYNSWNSVQGMVVAPGGVADIHVQKNEHGFSFSYPGSKRPHFDNSALERILTPAALHNIRYHLGGSIGKQISANMKKLSTVAPDVN